MEREILERVTENYILPSVLWDASIILMIDSSYGLKPNVWVHVYFALSSYLDQVLAPTPDTADLNCTWEPEFYAGGTAYIE